MTTMTMGQLRMTILRIMNEDNSFGVYPGRPARNVLSPETNNREQLGTLAGQPIDTVGDEDDMPEHLRDPTVNPDDCYGPVPPDAEEPYVGQDPFTRDVAPQPFSGGGRIKRG